MTQAQTHLYWRAWRDVTSAHGWTSAAGGLAAGHVAGWGSPELNAILQAVWETAALAAVQACRSVTAEKLRHACHVVALGTDKSSKHLSNPELDRVLALFRILADPDNLENLLAWQDQEKGARERLLYTLENAVSRTYAARISLDRFGTSDLESLPTHQLRQLAMTVRQRAARKAELAAADPIPA